MWGRGRKVEEGECKKEGEEGGKEELELDEKDEGVDEEELGQE